MDGSRELRQALDRLTTPPINLTSESSNAEWQAWLDEQVRTVVELEKTHPHSIRLHTRGSPSEERNCFMFALDIETDTVRDKCALRIFPGQQFINAMLRSNFLKKKDITPSAAAEGDLVLYFRDGAPEHAGKCAGNKIISKWGSGKTHIWQHRICEVPSSYGDEVIVYSSISDGTKLYREWATAKGL